MSNGNYNRIGASGYCNGQNYDLNSWIPQSPRPEDQIPAPGIEGTEQQASNIQLNPAEMAANVNTSMVDGIKQGVLAVYNHNTSSPVDSLVKYYTRSPVPRQNNDDLLKGTAKLWDLDINDIRKVIDIIFHRKPIPTLNGTPYTGGPSPSSQSPIGSSRGSPYSNSSPTQAMSSGSSPIMANYPSNANGGRHSAEMYSNYCDSGPASSSQSPEGLNYNFHPIDRNVDSRLSDDVNDIPYPPSTSSDSRSSDELSSENAGRPESVNDTKRSSTSSGSTRCNDCTCERVCDNCFGVYNTNNLPQVVDRAESAQGTSSMNQISPAIRPIEVVPYNCAQNIIIANQVTLPDGNQIIVTSNQMGMAVQLAGSNTFPISGQQSALPAPSNNQPLASSSPLVFLNQRIIPQTVYLKCPIHNHAKRFYCYTCSILFCFKCGSVYHVGHMTVNVHDAAGSAQKQAERVLTECRFGVVTIRDDIDKGVYAAQVLDAKKKEAIENVHKITIRLTQALLAREQELIHSIESHHQSKLAALSRRDEGLRVGLSSLSETIEKLTKSMEITPHLRSPLDLFVAKDEASAQIFHVKTMRNSLPRPEGHFIRFDINKDIFKLMNTFGSIFIGNGYIGDRRLLARPAIRALAPSLSISCARALPGANFRVSILNGRELGKNNPFENIGRSVLTIGATDKCHPDSLCRPWGVACDRDGHILIADRSNHRILIYRRNGSCVRRFGYYGTGRGQFNRPAGITVDANRRIVVSDKDNHRIQVFTMKGESLLCFGEKGSEPGSFHYPWDVSTNDHCQIVVSDTRNHRIQLFSAEGIFLRKFGFETQPHLWKNFDTPRSVAFNLNGDVIVTDFNNHRLIVIDSDFCGAKILGCKGLAPHPMPPRIMMRPQGLAIDDCGNIVVCDSRNHCLNIIDSNGVCRYRFSSYGHGPDDVDRPSGVAITPDGKIVVVDFGHNRVLVF